ncbi:tRNA(Met) cytidine acetyltransferase TmcA [Natronosalvus rutilus]|uniref:tRNA(Met) cytidine acetyltransferase TmcA n=1 Tax=Natronosalvus rutilus TaxID=2953753 RepID=A0A9E7SVH9_9EURY|nr:tRNA(Met) cytidine acetyltransferase TmcA [Natronosalvus rutilus]UTF52303.1 GNAT family N-acetyltransferase [Natronosalvus rutilus]
MNVAAHARALREEAASVDERRGLVLAGDRERGYEVLATVLESLDVPISQTTLVGPEDRLRCEHRTQSEAGALLGTTREVVVLDAHDTLEPNALGKLVGTIDAGGLLILLTPSLEEWPDERGSFERSMAVPPFELEDVTGRFRARLVETLRVHRGIAIVDVDDDRLEDDGLTHPAPRLVYRGEQVQTNDVVARADVVDAEAHDDRRTRHFLQDAYDACYTDDQRTALETLERLRSPKNAVVLEADRGRGKSSAIGLAAGCFAAAGDHVLVTAPAWANAAEAFARASELLEGCGDLEGGSDRNGRRLRTVDGGTIEYAPPLEAVSRAETADVVLVDEAAALSVTVLESLLAADRIAFATTIHGYEGAGRGFSVRFRDRLEASDHDVSEYVLQEPIRYAAGDPLEVWSFRAMLLDASPPVAPLIEDATPESVEYRRLEPDALLEDESLLREVVGLLVLAHYRTEPNDLARLLDAPNLETRALLQDSHVVSVTLLAREGNLSEADRARMYEGGRIRGNMIPDILTSHVRDESAGEASGIRVVRIATHHARRERGLGSHLLERIREEFDGAVDWLGTGFGATPDLVSFWRANGYRTIHLSTTRNDTSGEYSAIMITPLSEAGEALLERHATRFARRLPRVLSDTLHDLDPDVVRAVTRSIGTEYAPPLELSSHEWRVVAGAAYGPGLYDVDPGPFRRLVISALIGRPPELADALTTRQVQLLVRRVLQAHTWDDVAADLEFHSPRQCMRAFGSALQPLVDHYGTAAAQAVRERFLDDESCE